MKKIMNVVLLTLLLPQISLAAFLHDSSDQSNDPEPRSDFRCAYSVSQMSCSASGEDYYRAACVAYVDAQLKDGQRELLIAKSKISGGLYDGGVGGIINVFYIFSGTAWLESATKASQMRREVKRDLQVYLKHLPRCKVSR